MTLFVSAFVYVKHSFSYWKRKNVPFKAPSFPFGNFSNAFLKKSSFGEALANLYSETTEPFQGVFITIQPALLVRDPKIIKDIFIKDFQSFSHRGWQANVDVDPMANNILLQRGEKWKSMRQQFSPAFSSAKIKQMFGTMVDCGDSLDKYVNRFANTEKTIEMHEVFSKFAANVIASIGFGLDVDCFANPECEFRKYGLQFFQPTLRNTLRFNLAFMSPTLAKLLKMRFADKEIGEFMMASFRQNLEYRENNNVTRKDFFQLLMQLRNTGKVQDGDDWTTKATNDVKSLTLDEMTAQAFLFFAGGFESSATTMSFCMYELAKYPRIQQRVYEEIVEILDKYNGQLTYDSICDMKFTGLCIDGECVRAFSGSNFPSDLNHKLICIFRNPSITSTLSGNNSHVHQNVPHSRFQGDY